MEHAPSVATLVQAVRAHKSEVACLEVRGGQLASGGGRALRLWRWERGAGWQPAGEARAAHRYGVVALRWAPGGALLASGGVDGAVRVWCARSLTPRRQLAAPAAAAVRALCWPPGRLLAGHDDGALCVWAPAAGVLLARLTPHEGALHALATPARHALLLTACTHGVLKVFDLAEVCAAGVEGEGGRTPAPLQWVDGAHDLGALCADASEAGAAATGGHDACVRVWWPAPGARALRPGAVLEGHAAAVTALRWSRARGAAGELLASAALDRTARLWAPATGACLLAVAAHPRYLTCVSLAPDLRYLVTGSNDKSLRMWSLGDFSLEDELDPPCAPLEHFALGDLEGIGPVEEDLEPSEAGSGEGSATEEGDDAGERGEVGEGSGATCVWSERAHTGAINCIATWEELFATASSDGWVRVWRWAGGALSPLHALAGGGYPALAAEFGAAGAVLLAAGLDGAATLYDVQSGVVVRSLVAGGGARGGEAGGEAGGGGVRGARLSPHRAPLALLATDDGLVPLWRLADPDPRPAHVYVGHAEAVTCCAWSADGRVAATGAASGELRLLAPPSAGCLHHDSHAHDLGVLSCDFSPPCDEIELPEGCYLLATAGCDSFVKLWTVALAAGEEQASVRLERRVGAHGGAVASVRWGAGGLLASAGADRWARVWRVQGDASGVRARQLAAVPVRGAGGAPAATLGACGALLAVGTLAGELALWRLDALAADGAPEDEGSEPRLWSERATARWLRDYIIDAPGSQFAGSPAAGAALEARARAARLTGARLLDDPLDELLRLFGFDDTEGTQKTAAGESAESVENTDSVEEMENTGNALNEEEAANVEGAEYEERAGSAELAEGTGSTQGAGSAEVGGSAWRERACLELEYVRAAPPPPHVEAHAPHALLCPLTHRLLRWPARAADGFTYECANLAEWLVARGAVSPVSGRALRSVRLQPNYALLGTLRAFLRGQRAT